MGWGLPGILRLLPSPTVVPHDELAQSLELLTDDALIIDIGAGGRRVVPSVIAIDAIATAGVDVVATIDRIPLGDDKADCVICTGTLEHVEDPWSSIDEMFRILKPGGLVHIDVPFIQGYHPDPTDYWRFTLDGLKVLCSQFEEVSSGVHIGPSSAVVWVLREWANSLSSNRYVSNLFLVPMAILTAPLKYLDFLMISRVRAHHVASAVYFRGRKPFK